MVKKELKKLTLAATLTALSVALDISFKVFVPTGIQFGFPFYAIPIVIGSLILGPAYGGVMGYLSDLVGFFAFPAGFSYDPLFALSAVAWGVVPWFFAKTNSKWYRIGIAVLVAHLMATTLNTVSMGVVSGWDTAFTFLWVRAFMIPVNIIIISVITYLVNTRLEPIYLDLTKKPSGI